MTEYVTGRVCAHHPELEGKRYASNRACPACTSERNRSPERRAYKRQYQQEWREDPAVREAEAQKRAARRGPNPTYTASEWAGAQSQIRNLLAKLAVLRARIVELEARQ